MVKVVYRSLVSVVVLSLDHRLLRRDDNPLVRTSWSLLSF